MIKLNAAPVPQFLTSSVVTDLTNEYASTKVSVWNCEEIKQPLLASSHGKCAYCECDLTKESKYMEVEHFEDKGTDPTKVVVWSNLLPACKRCNGAKGTHNVRAEPIVNPYFDDPKQHIGFRLYRLKGLTQVGASTIEVVDLNNYERATKVRFDIGECVLATIEQCHERFDRYRENGSTKSRNRLLTLVESLLDEGLPTSSYTATTATIIVNEESFSELIVAMKKVGVWPDEFENKLVELEKYALKVV